MKKILFYLHFTKIGGAELVAMQYMQGLVNAGYKVDLIVDFNMGNDGNTFEYAIPKGIDFIYVKSEKVSKFIYGLRTLGKKNKFFTLLLYGFNILFDFYYYHSKIKKIMLQENYDFSISFYQFLPAYITSFKSVKHIIWLHGSVEHFFKGIAKLFVSTYGKKLNKYDVIVTIAKEMEGQLKIFYPQIPKEKIKRIYNPFDFKAIIEKSTDINGLNDDELKLLEENYMCTVTRLDENQKDLLTLILAYERLYQVSKLLDKLYVIGDGPSKNELISIVNEKNLQNQILFLGKKINPFIWMKNAKLFILSSKFEGLPTVLIEAMSVGTFVISSNCKTGPKEILLDGYCGDLFEVGNVDELSKKIDFAVVNDKYRNQKILKGHDRIKEFDKEISVANLIKILEDQKW